MIFVFILKCLRNFQGFNDFKAAILAFLCKGFAKMKILFLGKSVLQTSQFWYAEELFG